MPVQTIGNISLADSAPVHHSEHAQQRALKGGIGDRSPGNLIAEWPIPEEVVDEPSSPGIVAAIEQQFRDRPWLMIAGAAVLGIVVGKICVRR